jgi:hypothetical protein
MGLGAGRGNCAALSLERGLDLRKGVVIGQNLPLRDTLRSIGTKSGRRILWDFIFEIYQHVIDIYIYHSRVYISSIFVNEKCLLDQMRV